MKKPIDIIASWALGIAMVCLTVSLTMWCTNSSTEWSALLGSAATSVAAVAIAIHSKMRTYAFAAWVVCFVFVALLYPSLFLNFGSVKGTDTLIYLIQIAMFGMGATLTSSDFVRVIRMPIAVGLGFLFQFSFMPVIGWSVAYALGLPSEIAAGVILVGCCPGGVSSNVITYLAKGNVALSVTMTACTTLASPIMTPLMMYLLAGKSISVDYVAMFINIAFTVIAPVLAGLICNAILTKQKWASEAMNQALAIVSMIAICFICGIIAANSADAIRGVGLVLLLAVFLHNTLGYLLGYFGSKLCGVNEADSRTIAIEVGLQNGGLAASLATNVLKVPAAAIAPAIFAPVMNVTGSLLAAWWSSESKQHQQNNE